MGEVSYKIRSNQTNLLKQPDVFNIFKNKCKLKNFEDFKHRIVSTDTSTKSFKNCNQ